MDITFKILAVILAGVAAYFLWQGNADRAFAAAVFGAVSFFLSVRFQVRGRLNQREAERMEAEETEEDFDSEAPPLNEIPADEEIRRARQTTHDEQI
ncbi:MAG TPA: hypothetical protein VGC97_14265 [Pyrinomonadaceae bacterium]|jgi:hypothetical protein